MKRELYDYDIFPKVFLTGRPARVTVKPLGIHAAFAPGSDCLNHHPVYLRFCWPVLYCVSCFVVLIIHRTLYEVNV